MSITYKARIVGKGWMGQTCWMPASVTEQELQIGCHKRHTAADADEHAIGYFTSHAKHGDFSHIIDAEIWRIESHVRVHEGAHRSWTETTNHTLIHEPNAEAQDVLDLADAEEFGDAE